MKSKYSKFKSLYAKLEILYDDFKENKGSPFKGHQIETMSITANAMKDGSTTVTRRGNFKLQVQDGASMASKRTKSQLRVKLKPAK